MATPFDFKGKYTVVTGASTGIGRETAKLLAAEGSHLVLGSRPATRGPLNELAAELRRNWGVEVHPLSVDLAEPDGPREFFRQTMAAVSRVDVLINNAGLLAYGPFHEVGLERHEAVLDVNVRAFTILMRLFLAEMVKQGRGRVLGVSSVAAFQATPLHAVYGASKAYVQSLCEAAAEEVRESGVIVGTLNPSYTQTPMIHGEAFPQRLKWFRVTGLNDPADVARQAVMAVRRGKPMHITKMRNRLIHLILPRFGSRRLSNWISYLALKPDR